MVLEFGWAEGPLTHRWVMLPIAGLMIAKRPWRERGLVHDLGLRRLGFQTSSGRAVINEPNLLHLSAWSGNVDVGGDDEIHDEEGVRQAPLGGEGGAIRHVNHDELCLVDGGTVDDCMICLQVLVEERGVTAVPGVENPSEDVEKKTLLRRGRVDCRWAAVANEDLPIDGKVATGKRGRSQCCLPSDVKVLPSIGRMSQESTHGQYVPEPEHVSVHTVNTEGSSFTPPGDRGQQQNQPDPAGQPQAVPPPVVAPPVIPPLVMPQVAYEQMFPAMMAHYMQHMAQLMPMFQPPPPPQPQPRIVTFKTLKDNGAEEFRGDKMGEPQIALDWLKQMDRVLKNLRVPDADRSELASQMFRKGAYDWWKRIDQDPHTPNPWTWDRFDRAFTKEYVPTWYREERRDEFVALKQKGMSLPELRQKFDYLSQYATSLVSTPEDRLNEFVKKLRPDLRPYAALITTTEFNAARHCPTNPSSEPVFPRAPDQPATSHPARRQQSTAANNQQRPRPQQSSRAPARTYAMQGRTYPSPDVILGTFILFDSVMHALIDPGSTLSYICVGMPANSAIVRSDLEIPTVVSNPLGHSMRLHHIYHRCPLSVQGKQFPADLIELRHKEFDIILGMDWLTEHRAVVDCSCRTVRLRAEDGSDVSLSREVFARLPSSYRP
ncbi:unnamed protein product [Cuscuta campestris]|uniref:Retrotransposon gag domain-containing protein n=1 Tax=Cuscuta campestris TaxID=132261 RepID=A0A484MMP7_9ASTE|nr:unnamed protein product [Cuscuta campestris]